MLAQFGNIRFENLLGFNEFSTTEETDYAVIPMIGTKPKLQRTGDRLNELNITIRLHRDFCVPKDEEAKLRKMRQDGEIAPLIWGDGDIEGTFVIVSVRKSLNKTDKFGTPIYQVLDITLLEHPLPDRLKQQETKAKADAFAVDEERVIPQRIATLEPSVAFEAMELKTDIISNATEIDSKVQDAQRKPFERPKILGQIKELTDKVNEAALEMSNKVREIQAEIDGSTQIIRDATDTARFVSDLGTACLSGDINQVVAANGTFQGLANSLNSSSIAITEAIAFREI